MMPTSIEWDTDICQVKVPLPFPLRWVNAYLVRGRDGFTLIDPGLHTPESEKLWERTLEERGVRFEDISQIVLTHHHPDHYGLTGWFQERSAAPVLLSEAGRKQAERLWGDGQPLTEELRSLFIRHGLPADKESELVTHLNGFVPLVSPQPEIRTIAYADKLKLGDRACRIIHTPGHAFGHTCFYDEWNRQLFCGDHVLPQISPNVSYIPGVDENPLASFLQALGEIGKLEVERAYPGHREPFAAFRKRTEELLEHHRERLELMRQKLADRPMTVYELCIDVFGNRLSMHQLRFALSETLAHLIWLREEDRVAEREQGGRCEYQLANRAHTLG